MATIELNSLTTRNLSNQRKTTVKAYSKAENYNLFSNSNSKERYEVYKKILLEETTRLKKRQYTLKRPVGLDFKIPEKTFYNSGHDLTFSYDQIASSDVTACIDADTTPFEAKDTPDNLLAHFADLDCSQKGRNSSKNMPDLASEKDFNHNSAEKIVFGTYLNLDNKYSGDLQKTFVFEYIKEVEFEDIEKTSSHSSSASQHSQENSDTIKFDEFLKECEFSSGFNSEEETFKPIEEHKNSFSPIEMSIGTILFEKKVENSDILLRDDKKDDPEMFFPKNTFKDTDEEFNITQEYEKTIEKDDSSIKDGRLNVTDKVFSSSFEIDKGLGSDKDTDSNNSEVVDSTEFEKELESLDYKKVFLGLEESLGISLKNEDIQDTLLDNYGSETQKIDKIEDSIQIITEAILNPDEIESVSFNTYEIANRTELNEAAAVETIEIKNIFYKIDLDEAGTTETTELKDIKYTTDDEDLIIYSEINDIRINSFRSPRDRTEASRIPPEGGNLRVYKGKISERLENEDNKIVEILAEDLGICEAEINETIENDDENISQMLTDYKLVKRMCSDPGIYHDLDFKPRLIDDQGVQDTLKTQCSESHYENLYRSLAISESTGKDLYGSVAQSEGTEETKENLDESIPKPKKMRNSLIDMKKTELKVRRPRRERTSNEACSKCIMI